MRRRPGGPAGLQAAVRQRLRAESHRRRRQEAGADYVGAPPWIDDEKMLSPLDEALRVLIKPDVIITNSAGDRIPDIVHYHYVRDDQHFLLLQNTSLERSYDFEVYLELHGEVSIWDAETGETGPAPVVRSTEEGLHIPVSLPPAGATVLMIDPLAQCPSTPLIDADVPILEVNNGEAVGLVAKPGSYSVTVGSHDEPPQVVHTRVRTMPAAIELDDSWEFSTEQPNALPLTNWEYEIDNHTTGNSDAAEAQRIFTATFEAETIPEEARMLLDGLKTDKVWRNAHIRDHHIYLNGEEVVGFTPGNYLDHYIYEADLAGLIQEGTNEVKIVSSTFYFEPAMVYHPVVITGRFAVAGRKHLRIIAEPGQIRTGPWDSQGYPYYSGVATYRQQFRLSQNDLQIKIANSLQNLLLQKPKPSGLLGPVRIVPYKEIRFELQ